MALLGAYMNLERESKKLRSMNRDSRLSDNVLDSSGRISTQELIERAIHERKWSDHVHRLFEILDADKDETLSLEEFVRGYSSLKPSLSQEQLTGIFNGADKDSSRSISLDEFFEMLKIPEMEMAALLQPSPPRDFRGLIQIEPSNEEYFGERVLKATKAGKNISLGAIQSQNFSHKLYEARIASLQRFVAMIVMFHQMGYRVQSFFPRISCGLWGYHMDRTHSIMRIATTASPVGGADVREQMHTLHRLKKIHHAIHVISAAWISYKKRKEDKHLKQLKKAYISNPIFQTGEHVHV